MIDKSEKDWWKGKCLGGRVGYFPSAYVMRVESGQKTLQVTRNLQLTDQITLLRDQVSLVIITKHSSNSLRYIFFNEIVLLFVFSLLRVSLL